MPPHLAGAVPDDRNPEVLGRETAQATRPLSPHQLYRDALICYQSPKDAPERVEVLDLTRRSVRRPSRRSAGRGT